MLQGLPKTNGDGLPFASRICVPPAAAGRYKMPSSEALRLGIWSYGTKAGLSRVVPAPGAVFSSRARARYQSYSRSLLAADGVLVAALERHEQMRGVAESEPGAERDFVVIAVSFVVRSA